MRAGLNTLLFCSMHFLVYWPNCITLRRGYSKSNFSTTSKKSDRLNWPYPSKHVVVELFYILNVLQNFKCFVWYSTGHGHSFLAPPPTHLSTRFGVERLASVRIGLFLEKTSSHASIPQIRVAQWPKTPVELVKCIGTEDVHSIRRKRELCCVMCSAGTFIGCEDNVKSE